MVGMGSEGDGRRLGVGGSNFVLIRQIDRDPGALARRTLDLALTARDSGPLGHSSQSVDAVGMDGGRKADTPIANFQPHPISMSTELDAHLAAVAVAIGV